MRTSRTTLLRRFIATASAAMIISGLLNPVEAADIYAFAQQKVYGMTLNASAGSTATLVPSPLGFDIKSHTSATQSSTPGVVAFNGGIDTQQSQIGFSAVENYRGALPGGFSVPPLSNVLLQAVPTAWGTPNFVGGIITPDLGIPTSSDFASAPTGSRSDVYYNPNPDVGTSPGSGAPPAGIPLNGNNIPVANLFAPVGPPGTATASMSSMAEALLHNTPGIGTAVSDWVVSGVFSIN